MAPEVENDEIVVEVEPLETTEEEDEPAASELLAEIGSSCIMNTTDKCQ